MTVSEQLIFFNLWTPRTLFGLEKNWNMNHGQDKYVTSKMYLQIKINVVMDFVSSLWSDCS